MKKIKIKIFDAYSVEDEEYYKSLGINEDDLFEYHNQQINAKGLVNPKHHYKNRLKPIKPLQHDIKEYIKYELEEDEKETLQMLKNTMNQAEQLYDSWKRKYHKYETTLIEKLDIDVNIYEGDYWECKLSPVGRCLYTEDFYGESVCVFCGEPEERK